MAVSTPLELQPLNKAIHNREGFDCGVDRLNKWLCTQAVSAAKRNLSRTKVLVSIDDPATVIGYYSIANTTLHGLEKYPKQGAPALLLGRMAVDRAHQGKRIGEQLLLAAMRDTAYLSADPRLPPVIGLVVDPKDDAAGFYLSYGFNEIEMDDGITRLFMPVSMCVEATEAMS